MTPQAQGAAARQSRRRARFLRRLRDIALIALGLLGLSYLPPDTSLAQRQAQGLLRFCVADRQNPLVRAPDGQNPGGTEYHLIQAISAELGLRLQINEVANMGRAFNPRDWDISRAQCDILGGGLADSPTNRGFLALLPTGGEIGFVRSGPAALPAPGQEFGVYIGSAGLDRLPLSRWMRAQGYRARALPDQPALARWIAQGGQAIFPSDILFAPALEAGLTRHALPESAAQTHALAFGLWRGDITLTRRFRQALDRAKAAR